MGGSANCVDGSSRSTHGKDGASSTSPETALHRSGALTLFPDPDGCSDPLNRTRGLLKSFVTFLNYKYIPDVRVLTLGDEFHLYWFGLAPTPTGLSSPSP